MDIRKIKKLIELLEESSLTEIEIVEGDIQMKFDSELGMMVAESSGYSKVHITDTQIEEIHTTIKKIRKNIIK